MTRMRFRTACGLFVLMFVLSIGSWVKGGESSPPQERHFEIRVSAIATDLPSDAKVRIWMPIPADTVDQKAELGEVSFPNVTRLTKESTYGNRMIYCESTAGDAKKLDWIMSAKICRREIRLDRLQETDAPPAALRAKLLGPDRLVPISGAPIELLSSIPNGKPDLRQARMLYDIVDQHMTYDKSKPGYGNGDSIWACDSRTGNCTDFHSLFISLARSRNFASVFEIGFPLPKERGSGAISGYHCWAKLYVPETGWVPVDISEADKSPELKDYYFGNLTENRVTFSRGRDIVLEPSQDGAPLNYFVYPYVEVNGAAWPKEKVKLEIRYADEFQSDGGDSE